MGTLKVGLLQEEPDLSSCSCGVDSIDRMVREAYVSHILHQTRCYEISLGNIAVGYYQLSLHKISADDSSLCTDGYGVENSYYSLKIDFLAIQKKYQSKKIGTIILTNIIKEARSMCTQLPIRVILISALYERVTWYTDNGFSILYPNKRFEDYGTVDMIFDLLTEQEKEAIRQYCDMWNE